MTTVTIRNVSPQGALEVPLLGRIVGRGEEVEVTEAQAERLLPQAIWQPVDTAAKSLLASLAQRPDLLVTTPVDDTPKPSDRKDVWEAYAARQGINTEGLNKPAIIAAIDAHKAAEAGTGDGAHDNAGDGTNGDQS